MPICRTCYITSHLLIMSHLIEYEYDDIGIAKTSYCWKLELHLRFTSIIR